MRPFSLETEACPEQAVSTTGSATPLEHYGEFYP